MEKGPALYRIGYTRTGTQSVDGWSVEKNSTSGNMSFPSVFDLLNGLGRSRLLATWRFYRGTRLFAKGLGANDRGCLPVEPGVAHLKPDNLTTCHLRFAPSRLCVFALNAYA